MGDYRALISCRLVWDYEDQVQTRLAEAGVATDIPRFEGQQLEEPDLLPVISGYDAILAGDDHLTRAVLMAAARLKVISKWGVGVDSIDQRAASELGIQVYNTPGVFQEELADYAMGFIHMLARRQHEVDARVKAGSWHKVRGVSLAGKTLGIIGLGSSGKALARRAKATSMRVLGCDIVDVEISECEAVDLATVLSQSDVVSIHAPATEETRHLINSSSISTMKDGVWIVNTSRGALIDESALADALISGKVGAAALDVFEEEPIRSDSPLLSFGNVIVGSHNGSNTHEAIARTTTIAVNNLLIGLGLDSQ
jgi:D-3-phosphoglycerate dehydrogenase